MDSCEQFADGARGAVRGGRNGPYGAAIGKRRRDPALRGRQAERRSYVIRVDCRSCRRVADQHQRCAVPETESRGCGVRGGYVQRQPRRPRGSRAGALCLPCNLLYTIGS